MVLYDIKGNPKWLWIHVVGMVKTIMYIMPLKSK